MNQTNKAVVCTDIHASYGSREILTGISVSIEKNSRFAIIGPNGSGKSTLIQILAGIIQPTRGTVSIDGNSLSRYPPRKRAKLLAYMPQKPEGTIPYKVIDFVMLGRYASLGMLGIPSATDHKAVAESFEICNICHLAERLLCTLSQGELQRVLLAGAVAQDTPLLLLDEPTTFLDPAHERLFFEALHKLHNHRTLTTVIITHDINSALCQCSHIVALKNGKQLFCGTTVDFKNQCPYMLDQLFDIKFKSFSCKEDATHVYGSWENSCLL